MITPVLLCGGSGTRLWPLSRERFPKQFVPLLADRSLFQASAQRFIGEGFDAPLVMTANEFRFIVSEQLDECGISPAGILIEPEPRNTAPAALAAAVLLQQSHPQSLMLLVPSDHAIENKEAFCEAVRRAVPAALDERIVTFGINPTRAETGYGWLETGSETHPGIHELQRFVEKPDRDRADEMLRDGSFLWNAGIFLATASTFVEAFRKHAPGLMAPVERSVKKARNDLNFLRLDQEAWAQVESISIDYAVMEKADNLSVVRFDEGWSDLGSWESVWQHVAKDEAGNALSERTTAIDCERTLLRSESDEVELVGIGLKNIVAVAMRDAMIVADLDQSQSVKLAVEKLKARNARQFGEFPKHHRPWGWYETLVLADRFQVKRIYVHPGASLSLQSHMHRSEHWIVVAGTAKVVVNDDVRLVTENESVYVPVGSVHRMENPGKVPMVLIEVQTGAYLGEDDIVRYEDKYARSEGEARA